MRLFLDMDGVLADFDRGHELAFGFRPDKLKDDVDWDRIRKITDYYYTLPPMEDMFELWYGVKPLKPTVLTGVPSVFTEEASENKRRWIQKWLGPDVPVICCRSRDKSLHMQPGDIIIDDWDKHQSVWEEKGGIWILHQSAEQSLEELYHHLVITDREHPHLEHLGEVLPLLPGVNFKGEPIRPNHQDLHELTQAAGLIWKDVEPHLPEKFWSISEAGLEQGFVDYMDEFEPDPEARLEDENTPTFPGEEK